jgi:CubicO group peptidase (beta-lactamase class C family)
MATDERTQRPLGSATIISRRRFLKQTAFATAVVSVPYLGGSVAFGKEKAKSADAALDRALKDLVAMEGGPPGVIAVVQRGQHREIHTFGVRNIKSGLPVRFPDRQYRLFWPKDLEEISSSQPWWRSLLDGESSS